MRQTYALCLASSFPPAPVPNVVIVPRSFWKEVRQGDSCSHLGHLGVAVNPPVNLSVVDAGGGTTANPKDIKAIFRRGVALGGPGAVVTLP